MDTALIVGVILAAGLAFGELARRCRLPKVTGYIVAGICLNPHLLPLVPAAFPDRTDPVTHLALAFITFSVGGTLARDRLRRLGRTILSVTFFEAELAFACVVLAFAALRLLRPGAFGIPAGAALPLSLLMGALACPTDPTATLAVAHEYRARGDVATTIMGVAAFDDAFGIVNYALATAIARVLAAGGGFGPLDLAAGPARAIGGGVLLGVFFGAALVALTPLLRRETEGEIIVLMLALLGLCFGTAAALGVDELLATMTFGAVVANFHPRRRRIFGLLQRYTEELVFVLFFTLSGMHLDFGALAAGPVLVVLFVVARAAGKFGGAALGARLSGAPEKVRRYVAPGLIPQGGIVIGLALMMRGEPAFAPVADTLISVVIGATVIHEIAGPALAGLALRKAGEIPAAGGSGPAGSEP
ncbi:sodium:proton exchanger [Dissulfurirhabdus thermomarina]|uniref:Sodium:proton exchanger n=1 Tax=Dissulfurirhabdus thermomarina TaxID=1765737 RepID=A0A6N9TP13_DISTH|nr:cation:proton antiporter [Dissulfurirhabdus thermomarina]NDY43021.1 sodium:proton exchanger [Dissulfurirhabdus thermomarina]NMX22889.1 sodium:proton exchanger [Dissulfurirhabdus thermomarina]